MMRVATLVILALSVTAAQAASADFREQILAVHNTERAAVGVPPLVWSDQLAADAAPWARHLAQTGAFEHSPATERGDEGENLWEGTQGGFTVTQMVGMWADEKRHYSYGPFKNGMNAGEMIGHYTQMIWKNTTQIGCALASGGGNDVLVCRYSPPGNFIGQMPY